MLSERITYDDAKKHVNLRYNKEFQSWCDDNNISIHTQGQKKYLIKGKFLSVADIEFINELKKEHNDSWIHFYQDYEMIRPFLSSESKIRPIANNSRYQPKSDLAVKFYNKFFNTSDDE